MSSKVEINIVAGAMKECGVAPALMRQVIEALNAEVQASEETKGPPAPKKQFVILVSDHVGYLAGKDLAGWVFQIEESEHPQTLVDRIERTAHDYNATKKGRMMPVQTVGETCENVKATQFKENGVWVKTKTPVLVVTTKN